MSKNKKLVVLLAWALSMAVPFYIAYKLHQKNLRLENALEATNNALRKISDASGAMGNSVEELQRIAERNIKRAELLGRMGDENTGMMSLATSCMLDLISMVEIQKRVIARGTSPNEKEAAELLNLEINAIAASKSIPAYSGRITKLSEEMMALGQ